MATVFSGIQPTGNLTIGNYLGAVKNWVRMQAEHDCIYCIVDSHAITIQQDPKVLQEACLTNLALYIASGLDPKKSTIFIQSSVQAHAELAWILGCNTPMGWLNRMTQFKDKAGKDKERACLGLYAYPVLMAADILIYHATLVPVGDDQTQHVELVRDIAGAFNRNFGVEYFKLPDVINNKVALRIMSLRDGTKKMSKSDESDYSRINMTDSEDVIMQKVRKAKTDAIEGIYFDAENRPEISNLLNIYSAFTDESVDQAVKRFAGYKTSQFKEELAQAITQHLQPIQKQANIFLQDKLELYKQAHAGTERAAIIANKTLKEVKEIVGLVSY